MAAIALLYCPAVALAQSAPTGYYTEGRLVGDLFGDQKSLWTSPFRLKRSDAGWLAPLVMVAAVMMFGDERASREVNPKRGAIESSVAISSAGLGAMIGLMGGLYAAGRLGGSDRDRETALLGFASLIHANMIAGGLRLATSRSRPADPNGGRFFGGSSFSFPSGHSASAWALATVMAERYPSRKAIRIAAYGIALVVSVSRFTGKKHFPSDLFVGGALGHLIGRYFANRCASAPKSSTLRRGAR
jgi:membrane-associated phospholipid phosphatase